MQPLRGTSVRGHAVDYDKHVVCARCGARMKKNSRAVAKKITTLCDDCRTSDRGLAYLWRNKK